MNRKTYQEVKQRHPNMLLLFRAGDYFELYGEDAEIAAKLLGLALNQSESLWMAGFPHQALESNLRAFLRAGYRVAICDQEPALPKSEPTLF